MTDRPQDGPVPAGMDSHAPPAPASPRRAKLDEAALQQRLLLSIPEAAFLLRVGVRTVWRLMADPKSRFPTPRRIRGRTLLARDEVLEFMQEGAAR
jgi:excisionase family DNA binding protein